jgi:hypothetical protein
MATAAAKMPEITTPLDALLSAAPVRMIVPFELPFESIANPASPSVPKLWTPGINDANPTAAGWDWNTLYTFLRKALPTKRQVSGEEKCKEYAHQSKSAPAMMSQELVMTRM